MILVSILLGIFSITSIVFISLYCVERTKRSPFYKLKLNVPRTVATCDIVTQGTLYRCYDNGGVADRTAVIDLYYSVEIKYQPMSDSLVYTYLFNRGKTNSIKAQSTNYLPSISDAHLQLYPCLLEQFINPKHGSIDGLLRTAREDYRKVAAEKLEWKRQMETFMGTSTNKDL